MISSQSPIVATSVRVVSPLAVTLAAFLFFAGHNQPGGGFAAGLVLGSVVALRMLAGMPSPADAVTLLAVGAAVCGAVAVAPVLAGDMLLDQIVVDTTLPVLGKVKGGSALVFDLGVTLIVVGLVIAILEGLGAVGGHVADAPTDGAAAMAGKQAESDPA
jgi:multicomponent Na+:H+ antiporter subunit A